MTAKCPALTFHTGAFQGRIKVTAIVTDGQRQVGALSAAPQHKRLTVNHVFVNPEHQRCGIATRLYEIAGQYACANGVQLASDVTRSDEADLFWQKQVTKGRARRGVKAESGDSYYVLSCPVETLSRRSRLPARSR
jgi:predicted GNAT family acetyltransferase